MSQRLTGRVALVTGAGSGIGKATAEQFASEGATVVGADLTNADVEVDVADERSVTAMVKDVVERHGRIDVVMTAAGISGAPGVSVSDMDVKDWDRIIAVNLTGTMLTVRHAAAAMVDGTGCVITVASGAATKALPGVGAYCVSKAGVWMLTKVLALELGRRRIRVNCIAPGYIDTPMTAMTDRAPSYRERVIAATPLARLGEAEDIAAIAAFLASDDAAFVTGTMLSADGGLAAADR